MATCDRKADDQKSGVCEHGCKPDEFFMTVTASLRGLFSRHDRSGKQPFSNQALAWSV